MRKRYIWIWPTLVILIGIGLLFYENYLKVTEPPSKNWSREIELGLTPSTNLPIIQKTTDNLKTSYLTNDGVNIRSFDNSFTIIEEEMHPIPYDKWTKYYLDEDHLLYSDYYSMYDGESNEKISDIQQFIALDQFVLYQYDMEVYLYNPETSESTSILTLENEKTKLHTYENEQNTYLLTEYNGNGNTQLNFYEVSEKGTELIGESEFTVNQSEVIEDLQFTIQNETYSVVLTTYLKKNMSGTPESFNYFASHALDEDPEFKKIQFQDPNADQKLAEISDITIRVTEDQNEILFKGLGYTETKYRSDNQFNIYKAALKGDSASSVTRVSNTPESSASPKWVGKDTIVWLDIMGEENQLLLSSTADEAVVISEQIAGHYLMDALGKTLGMLSYSFLTIILGLLWFIWPMVFMLFIMFGKGSALDRDRPWILFTGIGVYLLAAFFYKDRVFTPELMARAPDYLSFPASPFIYIFIFALLVFWILMGHRKSLDWSVSLKLSYFVGIHLLFITIFFGPYLL
ncbi:hypothetical protein [Halobacillus andaensis]|uniref:hypothetical protein n=1 Tax=Halobacillus andaensis TaxID=1176239 RepID=UPI003D702FA0